MIGHLPTGPVFCPWCQGPGRAVLDWRGDPQIECDAYEPCAGEGPPEVDVLRLKELEAEMEEVRAELDWLNWELDEAEEGEEITRIEDEMDDLRDRLDELRDEYDELKDGPLRAAQRALESWRRAAA